VSISSAERIQKEGGKPGERAPSKKGKEKGKEAKEVSIAAVKMNHLFRTVKPLTTTTRMLMPVTVFTFSLKQK